MRKSLNMSNLNGILKISFKLTIFPKSKFRGPHLGLGVKSANTPRNDSRTISEPLPNHSRTSPEPFQNNSRPTKNHSRTLPEPFLHQNHSRNIPTQRKTIPEPNQSRTILEPFTPNENHSRIILEPLRIGFARPFAKGAPPGDFTARAHTRVRVRVCAHACTPGLKQSRAGTSIC